MQVQDRNLDFFIYNLFVTGQMSKRHPCQYHSGDLHLEASRFYDLVMSLGDNARFQTQKTDFILSLCPVYLLSERQTRCIHLSEESSSESFVGITVN